MVTKFEGVDFQARVDKVFMAFTKDKREREVKAQAWAVSWVEKLRG